MEHFGLLVIGMFTLLSSTGGKGAVPWKYFSLCYAHGLCRGAALLRNVVGPVLVWPEGTSYHLASSHRHHFVKSEIPEVSVGEGSPVYNCQLTPKSSRVASKLWLIVYNDALSELDKERREKLTRQETSATFIIIWSSSHEPPPCIETRGNMKSFRKKWHCVLIHPWGGDIEWGLTWHH